MLHSDKGTANEGINTVIEILDQLKEVGDDNM